VDQRELQQLLFAAARELLAAVDGPQQGLITVTFANDSGVRIEVKSSSPRGSWPLGQLQAADPKAADSLEILREALLSNEERAAVLALEARPLTAASLSKRVNVGLTSTKLMLAGLVARGILRSGSHGYEIVHPLFLDVARQANRRPTS
jgi:hypothetical protein